MTYGKLTNLRDVNGKKVYEFDRIECLGSKAKATVMYKNPPFKENEPVYALLDNGQVQEIENFGRFKILDEEANQDFVKKFDYRRAG